MQNGLRKGTKDGLKGDIGDGLPSVLPLINDPAFFEAENIRRVALQFKLPNPVFIEKLLWDYEVFCQLAALSEDFVLKGGAASQVYLPSDLQRASVDVDVATTHSKSEIEGFLYKIKEKFEKNAEHDAHFTWKLRQPQGSFVIEDLYEYGIVFPSVFEQSSTIPSGNWIQIDAIHYPELPFSTKTLQDPKVLGLEFKPFKIITEGSLIADKLLTLADSTVGILAKKTGSYPSYFKQVYDLTHLTILSLPQETTVKDVFYTLEKLTPLEVKYRQLPDKTVADIIRDVIVSLDKKRLFDFEAADKKLKDDLTSFQGTYLNVPERHILPDWVARLLKLKLIATFILLHYEEKLEASKLSSIFKKVEALEEKIRSIKGTAVKGATTELLKYLDDINEKRKIKNSPPIRVLYAVMTSENMAELFDKFEVE